MCDMCDTHTHKVEASVDIQTDFLEKNREVAEKIKEILQENLVKSFDIMGSIGSGKTSLIMELTKRIKSENNVYTIAGDLTTDIDARRIEGAGAEVMQLNTGRECHLGPDLILKSISDINLGKTDILFIENVGNLICPADYKLGTDKRIVVISMTEGPYMVLKHPYTFLSADIVVINKIDLAGYVEVDVDDLIKDLKAVSPKAKVFPCSCKTGEGVDNLVRELLQ